MAKPPSDAPVLFDVQSESSTIKQRKDGSYKLVLKGVERVHWVTDNDDAKEGLINAKAYARNFDEYYGKNAEVSAYQTFTLADGLKGKRKFSISDAEYDQKSKTLVYDIKPKHNNKTDKASHRKQIDDITGNDDSRYGNNAVYSKERTRWRPEWMPNGRNRNLSGQDLRNADLRGANLTRANLKKADLRGANLERANLNDANLMFADLREASLSPTIHGRAPTRWHRANFMYADLRRANMRGAQMERANLMFADLRGADLRQAPFDWGGRPGPRTRLKYADLSMADFRGANLDRGHLFRSIFIGADFKKANLETAYINYGNFTYAQNLDISNARGWARGNICPDGTMPPNNQICNSDQLIPPA